MITSVWILDQTLLHHHVISITTLFFSIVVVTGSPSRQDHVVVEYNKQQSNTEKERERERVGTSKEV